MESDTGAKPDRPLHVWLIVTGLLCFALLLLWQFGIISMMLKADRTYLSMLILLLFIVVTLYLGGAASRLARLNHLMEERGVGRPAAAGDKDASWIDDHFSLCAGISSSETGLGDALQGRLIEFVHRRHSLGWFAVDALIRLGLIGTVIGFILMLGAVYELKDEDVTVLQDLLGSMGTGMQVALYTTLTGISCSLVLSIYCKMLDHYADQLVSNITRLSAMEGRQADVPSA